MFLKIFIATILAQTFLFAFKYGKSLILAKPERESSREVLVKLRDFGYSKADSIALLWLSRFMLGFFIVGFYHFLWICNGPGPTWISGLLLGMLCGQISVLLWAVLSFYYEAFRKKKVMEFCIHLYAEQLSFMLIVVAVYKAFLVT